MSGATPEQQRANRRLGLLLGGLVIAVVIAFIGVFTRGGLPEDPGVWRRLRLEQSSSGATLPVGESPIVPSLAPAQESQP
jgi:hypothetical protein